MRIFNADGSEAEMCGNGIRCLARFLADSDGDGPGRRWPIETPAGLIVPELQVDGQICVDMGAPFLEPAAVPTTLKPDARGLPVGELNLDGVNLALAAVGMGNPHAIVPVDDLSSIPFERWGAELECHEIFPAKTNVHFLKVHGPSQLEIRVWERGAGPTLACGTGACATLVAAVLLGLSDRQATVNLPGGPLQISWEKPGASVFMTGPAAAVFDGVLNPELMPFEAVETVSRSTVLGEDNPPATTTPPSETTANQTTNSKTPTSATGDDCSEEEAQARVQAFLAATSLDSMINIATESLEERTLSRFQRDVQP
jgi:diaminopimelate epimerase